MSPRWKFPLLLAVLLSAAAFAQRVQVFDASGKPQPRSNTVKIENAEQKPSEEGTAAQDLSLPGDGAKLEGEGEGEGKGPATAPGEEKTKEQKLQEKQAAEDRERRAADLQVVIAAMQDGKTLFDIATDAELKKKLISAYEVNPMSELPRELVEKGVEAQLAKASYGKLITEHAPRMKEFLVEVLHDPQALGQLFKILDKGDAFFTTTQWVCGFLVIFYFVRRSYLFTIENPIRRRLTGMAMSFAFSSGVLFSYYFQVRKELAPTLEIFSSVFL